MSQVNTNAIYDASGGQSAQLYGVSMRYGGTNFVNRIINGDMRIDQRNAGAAVTVDGASVYTLDRWRATDVTSGAFTVQQSSVAPSGFNNSSLITVTSAAGSYASTDQAAFIQRIEGFNIADFAYGTASATPTTLSFWVRSSVTGSFGGALQNNNENYSFPFLFTISAANTWEYKTIAVSSATAGTWVTNNGLGLVVRFSLAAGSSRLGTAGAWAAADHRGATGQTNLLSTSGATFYLTGVQLEAGAVATPFERRPYGTELQLAQRYYLRYGTTTTDSPMTTTGAASNTTVAYPIANFPVTMRAAPTLSRNGCYLYNPALGGTNLTNLTLSAANTSYAMLAATVASGLTSQNTYFVSSSAANPSHFIDFSAEL